MQKLEGEPFKFKMPSDMYEFLLIYANRNYLPSVASALRMIVAKQMPREHSTPLQPQK